MTRSEFYYRALYTGRKPERTSYQRGGKSGQPPIDKLSSARGYLTRTLAFKKHPHMLQCFPFL